MKYQLILNQSPQPSDTIRIDGQVYNADYIASLPHDYTVEADQVAEILTDALSYWKPVYD